MYSMYTSRNKSCNSQFSSRKHTITQPEDKLAAADQLSNHRVNSDLFSKGEIKGYFRSPILSMAFISPPGFLTRNGTEMFMLFL
jgi:hypothetical protein